jgi:hypothetical protein
VGWFAYKFYSAVLYCTFFLDQNGPPQQKAKVVQTIANTSEINNCVPRRKIAKNALYNFEQGSKPLSVETSARMSAKREPSA